MAGVSTPSQDLSKGDDETITQVLKAVRAETQGNPLHVGMESIVTHLAIPIPSVFRHLLMSLSLGDDPNPTEKTSLEDTSVLSPKKFWLRE